MKQKTLRIYNMYMQAIILKLAHFLLGQIG